MKGLLFGPGCPAAGARVDFEAGDAGLRVSSPGGATSAPQWREVELAKSGWDGAQLRLEWRAQGNVWSLTVDDAQAAAAVGRLAKGKAAAAPAGGDRRTRAWAGAILMVAVVVPLLLAAVLAWKHSSIAAWAVERIPVEHEAKLGEILFSSHKAGLKLVEGEPLEMVRGIGARLTTRSAHKYQFFVADDPSVNAFALPGGFVVMHTGLLKLAESSEEVAGVLAHEVSHVEQRHGLRAVARSLGLYAVMTLLLGDVSGLASLGGDLLKLRFSREDESEADRLGLEALVAARIDPSGMRDFFARMAKQDRFEPGLLSSHPASTERMAAMDRLIQALPPDALKGEKLAFDYARIKASIASPK